VPLGFGREALDRISGLGLKVPSPITFLRNVLKALVPPSSAYFFAMAHRIS
jgi:hypothetical protein